VLDLRDNRVCGVLLIVTYMHIGVYTLRGDLSRWTWSVCTQRYMVEWRYNTTHS